MAYLPVCSVGLWQRRGHTCRRRRTSDPLLLPLVLVCVLADADEQCTALCKSEDSMSVCLVECTAASLKLKLNNGIRKCAALDGAMEGWDLIRELAPISEILAFQFPVMDEMIASSPVGTWEQRGRADSRGSEIQPCLSTLAMVLNHWRRRNLTHPSVLHLPPQQIQRNRQKGPLKWQVSGL